jgi:hypothetical protein
MLDLPEGVSKGLYFFGILFEFVIFTFVLLIVILSIRKLRERGTRPNKYMVLICIGMDCALFSTAFGKLGVLFFEWSFEVGTVFDNIALLCIFFVNCVFLLFTLEIFTQMSSKKQKMIFIIYVVCYNPAFIITLLNIFAVGIVENLVHLALSLTLYIFMIIQVRKNLQDIAQKIHKIGLIFILLTAIFMLSFFLLTGTSILLITLGILNPFNFLYFLSWVCMVLALFLFYTGFFLPAWVKNVFEE